MHKSQLLYSALRIIVKPSLWLFYRRLQAEGVENIPVNRPVIFAVNHHNAFLDALCTLYFVKGQSYSAVRSDVFENKFVRFLFYNFGMVPVYRIQDGYGKLGKNDKSFGRMKEVITEGSNLLIFPEATHSPYYHLKPLRKGLARLAASLLIDKVQFSIVPVGLFFTERYGVRGDVLVRFGDAIHSESLKYHQAEHVGFVNNLTTDLQNRMGNLLPKLPENADTTEIGERVEQLCNCAPYAPVIAITKALEESFEKGLDHSKMRLAKDWPKQNSKIWASFVRYSGKLASWLMIPIINLNKYLRNRITDDIVFRQSLTYSSFVILCPAILIIFGVLLRTTAGQPWGCIIMASFTLLGLAYLKSREPGYRN